MTQKTIIEKALLDATEKHPDYNKIQIITVVAEKLNIPRSTIRRVKRDLLITLNNYVRILK